MEYKYITQEVIDKGVITATSLDVYNEVEQYNEIMRKMKRKKQMIDNEFIMWCIIQFGLLGIGVFYIPFVEYFTIKLIPVLFGILYAFLFIFFILYKKDRRPVTVFLISLLLPFASLRLISLIAANTILCYLYNKFYEEAKSKMGYPYFSQIMTK